MFFRKNSTMNIIDKKAIVVYQNIKHEMHRLITEFESLEPIHPRLKWDRLLRLNSHLAAEIAAHLPEVLWELDED